MNRIGNQRTQTQERPASAPTTPTQKQRVGSNTGVATSKRASQAYMNAMRKTNPRTNTEPQALQDRSAVQQSSIQLNSHNQLTTKEGVALRLVQLCGGNRKQAIKYLDDLTKGKPNNTTSARYQNALEGLTDDGINELKEAIDPSAGKKTVGAKSKSTRERTDKSNQSASKIFQKIISGSWVKALTPKGFSTPRETRIKQRMRAELVGLIDRKTTEVELKDTSGKKTVVRQRYGVATYEGKKVQAPKTGGTASSDAANTRPLKGLANGAGVTLETDGKEKLVIFRSGRPTDPIQAVQVFATSVARCFELSGEDPPPGLSKVDGQDNTYSHQHMEVGLMDRNSFKSALTELKSRLYDAGFDTAVLMGSIGEARARPVESEKDFMKMIDTIAETLFAANAPEGLSDSDKAELDKMGIRFKNGQLEITVARNDPPGDAIVQIKKPIIQSHSFNVMASDKKNVRQVLKENKAGQLQMLQGVDASKFPNLAGIEVPENGDLGSVPSALKAVAENPKASAEEKLLAHCFHAQLTGKRIQTKSNPTPRPLEQAEDQADMAVMLAIQCQLLNIVPSTFCKSGNDRTPLAVICHMVAAEMLSKDGGATSLLRHLEGPGPLVNQRFQEEAMKHKGLIVENLRYARGKGERGLHTTFKVANNPVFTHIFGEEGANELAKEVFIPDRTPKLKSLELKPNEYTPK